MPPISVAAVPAAQVIDPEYTFMLRSCNKDLQSRGGAFQYPETGHVRCVRWDKRAVCGDGLHGLLHGAGNYKLCEHGEGSRWLVLKVRRADVVVIDNEKCKVPEAWVVFVGDAHAAIRRLIELDPEVDTTKLAYQQSAASGYGSQSAASGDWSQSAASGERSQSAASGERSQSAASGERSQSAASGDWSQSAASGYGSQSAASGDWSQSAASGYGSQSAASGYGSQSAASGYGSQSAASGERSQSAASGERSRALAFGSRSRAKVGPLGFFVIVWWDAAALRERVAVGYAGENGIKQDTWYRVNASGSIEQAPDHDYTAFTAPDSAAKDARTIKAKDRVIAVAAKAVAAVPAKKAA